ncbi:MAG: hypothetical protein Q9224_001245 [Gallowayella concinna]
MPQADDDDKSQKSKAPPKTARSPWLTTPNPIRRLFDKFPLLTYPLNELPLRKPIERNKNTLFIFGREDDAQHGAPSFNPTCLKWQTYLKFRGVDFVTVPSSNHASPTGSLPYLIPAASRSDSTVLDGIPPVPSHKIQEWASKNGSTSKTEPDNMRYEAYLSLLDHRIRSAWLHTLYLSSPNFDVVARPLYITPTTSSPPVRLALAKSLQAAALEELTKSSTSPVVDIEAMYRESDNAFSALSELLGDDVWFFGEDEPSLFDAGVFAYIHLLCDEKLGWKVDEERLGKGLREGRWKNLMEHERRIFAEYYQ